MECSFRFHMRIGFSSCTLQIIPFGGKDTNYFSHYVIKVLKMLYLEAKILTPPPLPGTPPLRWEGNTKGAYPSLGLSPVALATLVTMRR